MKHIHSIVSSNLNKARETQKKYADRHRRPAAFNIGDFVLLDTKNLILKGTQSRKLSAKFVGPYRVIAKYGSTAYKLDLPVGLKIHPVFHVSLLKKYQGLNMEGDSVEVEDE